MSKELTEKDFYKINKYLNQMENILFEIQCIRNKIDKQIRGKSK